MDEDDNSNSTTLSSDQKILDPRPSIAKTSISITDTANDEFAISKHISRLKVASSYLKPVIDEIVNRTTSYTQLEFKELLETQSPICSISVEQFSYACKASEIIGENPYFTEYIVNPVSEVSDDRILIDRDLLKQLVDLQAMILATINRLKDNVDDMDVTAVRKELEDNFVVVDRIEEAKQRDAEEQISKLTGVQTLTVKNYNKRIKTQGMEKVSEMTAKVPTSSDLAMNFDRKAIQPIEEAPKSDDESELILKTDFNEMEIPPKCTVDEICDCKIISNKESDANNDNSNCKQRMCKFEHELEEMKEVVRHLTEEVAMLKGMNNVNSVNIQPVNSNPSRKVPQQDLECEILDCLKELRQIKDVLGRMNNPDLTLDRPPRNGDEPCCKLCDFPHIHAKLNGIPVIIKLNKSSIDILLSEEDKPKSGERRCRCKRTKQTESMIVTEVQSYVRTKYNTVPYPELQECPSKRKDKTVVQSAFETNVGSDLDFCDSLDGLPYTVNKKSLPSVSTCPSMNINIDQLKRNMRSEIIQHPKNNIQQHLAAVGVDNLIKASIPAECCREAVINEAEREEEPFHASINSLPLTTSDLKIIADSNKCTNTQLEYYTNFQENIASNIEYYMPKSRVYEVRFFRVFRTKEQKSRTSLTDRLSDVLRRIIFNDVETKANNEPPKILMRNRKCQTDGHITNNPPPVKHKLKKTTLSKGKIRSSSVQCKIGDTCEGDNSNQKCKYEKYPSKLPVKQHYFNSNQSIFACNTNLGTIYESEERHHRRKIKNRPTKCKDMSSITDFLNSPSMSESFQKFLASEAAAKAMGGEQFWAMYFEAKKSHRDTGSQHSIKEDSSFSVHKRRYGKYRKSSISRIPRRIVKHTFSSTSTDGSTAKRVKRLKTQERISETNELVVKVKPKVQLNEKKSEEIKNKPIAPSTSTMSLLEMTGKYETEISKNTNIFSEENHDTSGSDYNQENSLESLQLLASKNGPGYITVLHPVCGCPEVSIFIPCYCQENSHSVLSRDVVQKLVCRNDGRHIILPKGCRVEKCEGSCNDVVKENG